MAEIASGPADTLDILIHAVKAAGRPDLQDDVKDAVVAVSTAADNEDAVDAAKILMGILNQGIGIDEKVQMRESP